MATFVSSIHLQQANRIRSHLKSFRDRFVSYNYTNNIGLSSSGYPFWINLCLITTKVRPAFIVRWNDFVSVDDYDRIMQLLIEYRNTLSWNDLDYRLYFITTPIGIIVTTYYTYFKQRLYIKYQQYQDAISINQQEVILGEILGDPAAEDKMASETQLPGYKFSIYVKLYGLDPENIFKTMYRQSSIRQLLYNFYDQIVKIISVYDPEAQILIEDEQKSLGTSDRPNYFEINGQGSEQRSHKEFTQSWNDEFDRIFTIGFNYH